MDKKIYYWDVIHTLLNESSFLAIRHEFDSKGNQVSCKGKRIPSWFFHYAQKQDQSISFVCECWLLSDLSGKIPDQNPFL